MQVYTDMTAEWTTGNTTQLANWTTSVSDVITHQVQLQQQTPYTEVDSRIQREWPWFSQFLYIFTELLLQRDLRTTPLQRSALSVH